MQSNSGQLLKDRIVLLVGAGVLWSCLAIELPGQTMPSKQTGPMVVVAKTAADHSTTVGLSSDVTTTPAGDSENARKLRDKLRTQFSEQKPQELAEAARDIGNEARAKFQYGRVIAVWRAREIRMTEQRVELRKLSEQKVQERAKERIKLDKAIEQVRQQFQADQVQCERQLTELIQSYRPKLLQLKDEATQATVMADKTDTKLGEIRREILSLEQRASLVAQGKPTKSARGPIVDQDFDDIPPFSISVNQTPTGATATASSPSQSVEQMLKDLD